MPSLVDSLMRFATGFTRLPDGRQFQASANQLTTPLPNYDAIFVPRQQLIVPGTVEFVLSGDWVRDEFGNEYLVSRWGEDQYGSQQVGRSYVLFPVTGRYTWVRLGGVLEPVSGLQHSEVITNFGEVPVMVEPMRRETDSTERIESWRWRVLTNAAVQVGDLLNDQRVIAVHSMLDLWVVHTR